MFMSSRWYGAAVVCLVVLGLAVLPGCPSSNNNNGSNTGGNASGQDTGGNTIGQGTGGTNNGGNPVPAATGDMVVFGYNDLGMHCMNQDFSQFMILPPFNTVRAQVIDRTGEDPRIVTSGVTVSYNLIDNTHSADKTNFWQYAKALLNVTLSPDVGLAGNGLSGTMQPSGTNDWVVVGIPVTPINDANTLDPYPLARISVTGGGQEVASTEAVVPVSWEISCDLCHTTQGISVATDILRKHDQLHPMNPPLEQRQPVACGSCHGQPPLAGVLNGDPNVSTLSRAMHHAHAPRMGSVVGQTGGTVCYACHPGIQTKCLRDVHYAHGLTCESCHLSMSAVADPNRKPWVDEPRCGTCHTRTGSEYEQPNTLYRDSKGHNGVHCSACHGSPHAITPTVTAVDNTQAIAIQGHAGTINTCTVCHKNQPDDNFNHTLGDGG